MNVGQAVQDLPEEPPQAAAVQVQSLVNGVPQRALLTVLHLHREERRGEGMGGQNSEGQRWTRSPPGGQVTQCKIVSGLTHDEALLSDISNISMT